MPLTTVVGSSGSGKTTFLNDVAKRHKCTYIRQYHNIRPYIPVAKIPQFDPTQLPYWDIYEREGTADTIKVGGHLGNLFTAGLSGGQRKLLLFELLFQRTTLSGQHQDLLLVLDEPFAGVTDDFVPYIIERLHQMRKIHNLLVVTNDHVQALTDIADNTLTVSAIDRTRVQVHSHGTYIKGVTQIDPESGLNSYDREKAIMALSVGEQYHYKGGRTEDFQFFWETEVVGNNGITTVLMFIVVTFAMFAMTFWNSDDSSAPLILIAGGSLAFFVLSPFLMSLVEWRNYVQEEAEALLHSSKGRIKLLKTILTLSLMLFISSLEFGILQLIMTNNGLAGWEFYIGVLMDNATCQLPSICFGIFTNFDQQTAEMLAGIPILMMVFFSTTYSPGGGIPYIKELRYLFARYYLWCMTPFVGPYMEECPEEPAINMILLVLTGLSTVILFVLGRVVVLHYRRRQQNKVKNSLKALQADDEFVRLQAQLFGATKNPRTLHHADTERTFQCYGGSSSALLTNSSSGSNWAMTPHTEKWDGDSTASNSSPTMSRSASNVSFSFERADSEDSDTSSPSKASSNISFYDVPDTAFPVEESSNPNCSFQQEACEAIEIPAVIPETEVNPDCNFDQAEAEAGADPYEAQALSNTMLGRRISELLLKLYPDEDSSW